MMLKLLSQRSEPVSPLYRLALVLLCGAYLQGPVIKLLDFDGALAEMRHFGLHPPGLMAVAVIAFELLASAMVISGIGRKIAALALAGFTLAATFIALRFWEMPMGPARAGAINAFFEHFGLIGGFLMVAIKDAVASPETRRGGNHELESLT